MGQALVSPEDPFCRQRQPDDTRYIVDHFYAKLLRLSSSMQTSAGHDLAVTRTEFLRDYLKVLETELGT